MSIPGGDIERIPVQLVSGGYYATLGVNAFGGRLIDDEDDKNRRRVAVLSHAFWVRRFGGDPSALGRTLNVNGVATTPRDPSTAIACAVVLLAVGGLSGYLPARRAARLEPMSALRSE